MLKTLGSQVKEYKLPAILTPLCMIGEVIFEMLIPLLMASIIDDGVEKGDMHHILMVGIAMLVMALGGLFFGVMGGKFGSQASTGLARNLREAMYNNIQTFSFSNIDKFSTSSLITRLTTDVTNVQNAFMMILRMCFRAPISLIVAMGMSFYINAHLATVYLIAVMILGVILFFIIRKATTYFSQIFPKYDDLNESIEENVRGIRIIKAFVRQDYETEKLHGASAAIYKMFVRAEKMVVLNGPLMMTTVYTCILLLSWLGAKAITAGSLTTGELMSLLTYCMNILMSLMMLSIIFVMITLSMASAQRICEVLEEKADLTNPEDPVMEVKDGDISFEHVDFRYRKTSPDPVLKDINLHIHSGETIGIIGGTGSAKTSLVNLLSRLYDVDQGSVSIGGLDVRKYDLDVLRRKVAVVLQKNVLFSGSIIDNLRWGKPDATEEECIAACKIACADEFIDKMPEGYHTMLTQGATNVSGGQKQRLCIARALLCQPKVIIFDDSTSAVDTATDAKIRKGLAKAIPETTKIIIAQRISSVKEADRIIVMEDGRIDAFATHEELLETNEIYREVYESQMNGNGDFDEGGDQ